MAAGSAWNPSPRVTVSVRPVAVPKFSKMAIYVVWPVSGQLVSVAVVGSGVVAQSVSVVDASHGPPPPGLPLLPMFGAK